MRMLVAHTVEIDDPELAVKEICGQLDLENNLLKNAVGILVCHADCLNTGAARAICDKMPFDVVGMTSLASAVSGEKGLDILTLAVLTCNEIVFTVALTDSLVADQEGPILDAYTKARAKIDENPGLILTYAPLLAKVGGEKLVNCITAASNGAPLFGSLACDHNYGFQDAHVIFNGESYQDRLVMVLVSGPVKPKFFFISIRDENIQKQKAVITDSDGNLLRKVNDMPASDYLASIGLTADGGLEASVAIPFIVDYNDGTQPVARGLYKLTDDDSIVCGGDMPVSATLALAVQDVEDVMSSAAQLLDCIAVEAANGHGVLFVSCVGRSMILDTEPLAEAGKVLEAMSGIAPCHLLYSGGEICPVYKPDGSTLNRFHNFSFTACVFEK